MTTRDAFLDRARRRMGSAPMPTAAPPAGVAVPAVPAVRYTQSLDDPVRAFATAAAASGATVRFVEGAAGIAGLVAEVVAAVGARTAVLSRDPLTAEAVGALARLGVGIVPFDGPAAAAGADLGITGARWGVAATGSVALDAAWAGGRTASLLVPVHLVLLAAGRIVADAGALFRDMVGHFPGGLPSQLVLATGPSRSADIELVLTVGVHGPKQVWVGIVDAAEEEESRGREPEPEGVHER